MSRAIDQSQYHRDTNVIRRRLSPPRDLVFDQATREARWTLPADADGITHFNLRVDHDDADPDFQVPPGTTKYYIPNGSTLVLSSYNEQFKIESQKITVAMGAGIGTETQFLSLTLTTASTAINTASAPMVGDRLVVTLTQDATGGRNVTWGANFGKVPRFIVRTPNAVQRYEFIEGGGLWQLLAHDDEYSRSEQIRRVTADGSVLATDETVEIDSTAAAITLTALGANNYIGRTFTFKRVNAGANAITIQMAGADTVDSASALSLATQWESATIRSIGGGKYIRVGAAVSSTSTVTQPVPGDVTLGTPTYRLGQPDADGKVLVLVTVPYTPPSPIGTFDRVIIYLQAPDDAAPRAIVSDVGGFVIGPAADASRIVPVGNPINKGTVPYKADELILAFSHPAPPQNEVWRIYAVSGSSTVENKLVRADLSGASPSVTITISVPAAGPSGAEYVPLAASFSMIPGFPAYSFQDGGDQLWGVAVQWTNATTDPRFPKLDGYYIVWEYYDGRRERAGFVSPFDLRYDSDRWPVPGAPEFFTLYLVSAAEGGRLANSIIPGTTPSLRFEIKRQDGTAGREYANLITNPAASATYDVDGSGQKAIRIDTSWVEPTEDQDPRFAGTIVTLRIAAEDFSTELTGIEADSPAVSFIPPEIADKPASIAFISADTSGRKNTYVNGVTPEIPITLPGIDIDVANVTGFSVTTGYRTNGDGQKVLVITPYFTPPADPQWASISFEVEISGDPATYVLGFPFEGGEAGEALITDFPQAAESWAFRARSIDVNGQAKNGFVRFPASGYITVGPPTLGPAGTEYTGHVTGASASVSTQTTSDGTVQQRLTLLYSPPSDVTWGGVELRVYDGSTLVDKVRSSASPGAVTATFANPSTSVILTWKLVSFDVNGKANSETGGTPQGTVIVGSAAGTLDLRKFLPASTDNFTIVGSSLRIKTGVAMEVDGSGNLRVSVNGITSSLIAAGAVGISQLLDNAVTDLKIAASAVTAAKLAASAVTAPAIAASAVTAPAIAASAVTAGKIAANAVTANEIAALSIVAGKIAANAVTAGEIAADAVTSAKILAGSITTVKIAAGAVTANEVAANAIVAGKIAANAVSATEIAANSIIAGKIATNAVAAANIQANAIASDKLDANFINVGGGGGKPGQFRIFNSFGSQIGFIGVNGGFQGGWVREFRVGGTSESNAKLVADSSGNLSIVDATFSLTLSSAVTEIANIGVGGYTTGLRVKNQFNSTAFHVAQNRIFGYNSSGGLQIDIGSYLGYGFIGVHDDFATARIQLTGGASFLTPNINITDNGFGAEYRIGGNAVVRARRVGWTFPSGVSSRASFDTATVTTQQLAERVKALLEDLGPSLGHGLIG